MSKTEYTFTCSERTMLTPPSEILAKILRGTKEPIALFASAAKAGAGQNYSSPFTEEEKEELAMYALNALADFSESFFVIGNIPADAKLGFSVMANERERQIKYLNFDKERDARYTTGELSAAGYAYEDSSLQHWPEKWSLAHFKPTSQERNEEKAGALYLAEMDRLLFRLLELSKRLTERLRPKIIDVSHNPRPGFAIVNPPPDNE